MFRISPASQCTAGHKSASAGSVWRTAAEIPESFPAESVAIRMASSPLCYADAHTPSLSQILHSLPALYSSRNC